MVEWHVLEDDDWVFGGVLFQEGLEVGRAGRQNHLVGLTSLSIARQGDVSERLLVPEVFEGRHHVGLEVVPSQAKLLLIAGHCEVFLVGGLTGTTNGNCLRFRSSFHLRQNCC